MSVVALTLPLYADEGSKRDALHSNLARMESSLSDEWQERLRFEALKAQSAAHGHADLALLDDVLRRLATLETYQETPPDTATLASLRQTVEEWLAKESMPAGPGLLAVASSILHHASDRAAEGAVPDRRLRTRQWLRPRLVTLIGSLANYRETAEEGRAASIAVQLDALAESRDAAPLVAAVRDYYGHPNLWIDISEDLLDDSIEGVVDRWDSIDTVILETPVAGTGRVQALKALVVEPEANAAVLKIVVEGTIDSKTIARRSSVRIKSHSLTSFRAEKPVVLDASGLKVLPTTCEATTQTLSSDVDTSQVGLRGQIIRRVAKRRSQSLREAADEESSLHAQKRVLEAVDREADMLVKRVNRLAVLPGMLLGSSSGSRLHVSSEKRVLRVGTVVGALGAPPHHPPCDDHQLVTIRVHQTLARQLASRAARDVGPASPAFAGLSRLFAPLSYTSWRPARLAWELAERTAAPRLTARGVTLRDGKWGTILPVDLTGEWLAAEWRPPVADERIAKVAKKPTN